MGTRSGDIDYAAAEFSFRKKGMTMAEGLTYLNKKCGMLGVSGNSSDFRDLTAAAERGDERSALALQMFEYACKKYIGAYMAGAGRAGLHRLYGGRRRKYADRARGDPQKHAGVRHLPG